MFINFKKEFKMKEKIVSLIKEHKSMNFLDLFKALTENSVEFSKPALRKAVEELEQGGAVINAFGTVYDPETLPSTEGYVQWTMTGFCWLDNKDNSNEYGITIEAPEDALQIFNKRAVNMSCTAQGKIIEFNEKKYFVAQNCGTPMKNVKIIYYKDGKNNTYMLNNENNCTLPIDGAPADKHIVAVATYDVQTNTINHTETLGSINDKGIESKIGYLLGNLVPAPQFEPTKITGNKIVDLNKKRFMTIDSKETKDRDDAICVEKTTDGYVIYVAIADVSSFVQKDTAEDLAARQASTTFYLHHDTIHMLSRNLAEDYCSLNPGVEKNALICQMNFDKDMKFKDSSFFEGTMISKACLTYNDVDRMFAGQPMIESTIFNVNKEFASVKADLDLLAKIEKANPMEVNRLEREYNRTELVLGEDGKVVKIIEEDEESTQSQKIVEFCMLRANREAAKMVFDAFGYGIFRNQDVPEDIENPKSAKYQKNATGHWGLNVTQYTHFTSPIRRYCDLSIHRMIKAAIAGKPAPYTEQELETITTRLNYQQLKSKQIFRKVNDMLMNEYIDALVRNKQLAKNLDVVEVKENGLVLRNKQNIEFFIPEFKVQRNMQDFIAQMPEETTEGKKLAMLRERFKVLGFVDEFSWLDGRLNVTYHVTDKEAQNKPRVPRP